MLLANCRILVNLVMQMFLAFLVGDHLEPPQGPLVEKHCTRPMWMHVDIVLDVLITVEVLICVLLNQFM